MLTELLKDAIRTSGQSLNAIAKATGVAHPIIVRFLQGKDLRLRTADKLVGYLRIEIRSGTPPKKKRTARRNRAAKRS